MGNAIRIRDDGSGDAFSRQFAEEFERLSGGIPWPPRNQAEWTTVMLRAGFDQAAINQILAWRGETGFDEADVGRLPRGLYSVPGRPPEGWMPFSRRLLAGLQVTRERSRPDDPLARGQAVLSGMRSDSKQRAYLAVLLHEWPKAVDIEVVSQKVYGEAPEQASAKLRIVAFRLNERLFEQRLEIREDVLTGFVSIEEIRAPDAGR
jgi:hypothetical protein